MLHRRPSRLNRSGVRRVSHYLDTEGYADDLLLGFIGTRSEAEEIKERIGVFLRDQLKLELSESKTLLTHATSESARFLGYQIRMERDDQKRNSQGNRTLNAQPTLELPKKAIIKNK